MSERAPAAVIVLDKPAGLTSNQALGRVKRLLGLGRGDKAGFLGTLDPLATGVLPVFVGKATKLIAGFERLDKTYRVTMRLGQRTDTLDADGTVIAEAELGALDAAAVRAAVLACAGEVEQAVPSYSAVKIHGVPAYKLARAGKAVPVRTRRVRLRALEVEAVALPEATFRVTASAGAYVRSLVADLGERLGVGAHVSALRRLACGCLFTEENSYSLRTIEERLAEGDTQFLRNPSEFLPDHLPLTVAAAAERDLRQGRTIPLTRAEGRLQPAAKIKAMRPCGTLVAIGEVVHTPHDALAFQPTRVLV